VEGYLTATQAARILGIDPASVRRAILQKRLKAKKNGAKWLIRPGDLEDYQGSYEPKQGRPRKNRPAPPSDEISGSPATGTRHRGPARPATTPAATTRLSRQIDLNQSADGTYMVRYAEYVESTWSSV
jgi:excisionase family DNA binding protein